MASFVETATLKVVDKSTAQINKINAALKKLFASARALKGSVKLDIKTGNLNKAISDVKKLQSALRGVKNTKVNIQVTGAAAARRQVQALARDMKKLGNVNVRTRAATVRAARAETRQLSGAALASSNLKKAQLARVKLIQRAERDNAAYTQRAQALAQRQQATAQRQQARQQAAFNRQAARQAALPAPPRGVRVPTVRPLTQPWGAVPPRPIPVHIVRGPGAPGAAGGRQPIPVTTAGDREHSMFRGLINDMGERIRAAIVTGFINATKEGTKQAAVGEYGMQALQLRGAEKTAAGEALDALVESEKKKPGGPLLNRGQLTASFAETLPVAAYDPKAAAWLAAQQSDLVALEVARGKSMETATEYSVKYAKAIELAGRLGDPMGKFDYGDATRYLNALKTIAPEIGKELTGESVFQAMKYARSARYTADPRAFQALMLTAEEMGPSSAGVAFNQAVRQLAGQNVPKETLGNLAKLGLVTTKEEVTTTAKGKKKVKTVLDKPLDEMGLRENLWKFATDKLMPRMRAMGLDPTNALDAVKFANMVASTQTAKDIITSALSRSIEITRALDRAEQRSPEEADRLARTSPLVMVAGLKSQFEGVMGQAVTAIAPIAMPAIKEASTYMADMATNINKAAQETDPDKRRKAQDAVENSAKQVLEGGAIALMGKSIVGQAIAGLTAPIGLATGLQTMADPTASPTAKTMSAAGISLLTAGQTLQAVAGELGVVAGLAAAARGLAPAALTALAAGGSAAYLGYTAYQGAKAPDLTEDQKKAVRLQQLMGVDLNDLANKNKIPERWAKFNETAQRRGIATPGAEGEITTKFKELQAAQAALDKAQGKSWFSRSQSEIDSAAASVRQLKFDYENLVDTRDKLLAEGAQPLAKTGTSELTAAKSVGQQFWDWFYKQHQAQSVEAQAKVAPLIEGVWKPYVQGTKKVPTMKALAAAGAKLQKAREIEQRAQKAHERAGSALYGGKAADVPLWTGTTTTRRVRDRATGRMRKITTTKPFGPIKFINPTFMPKGPVDVYNTGTTPMDIDKNTGVVNIGAGGVPKPLAPYMYPGMGVMPGQFPKPTAGKFPMETFPTQPAGAEPGKVTVSDAASKIETSTTTLESVLNAAPQKLGDAGTAFSDNASSGIKTAAAGAGSAMAANFRSGIAGITIPVGPMPGGGGAKPVDSGTQSA